MHLCPLYPFSDAIIGGLPLPSHCLLTSSRSLSQRCPQPCLKPPQRSLHGWNSLADLMETMAVAIFVVLTCTQAPWGRLCDQEEQSRTIVPQRNGDLFAPGGNLDVHPLSASPEAKSLCLMAIVSQHNSVIPPSPLTMLRVSQPVPLNEENGNKEEVQHDRGESSVKPCPTPSIIPMLRSTMPPSISWGLTPVADCSLASQPAALIDSLMSLPISSRMATGDLLALTARSPLS
jgi:hypothetical protein